MNARAYLESIGFVVQAGTQNDGAPCVHFPCGDHILLVRDNWEICLYANENQNGIRINWVQEDPHIMPGNAQRYHGYFNPHHLIELLNQVGVTSPEYAQLSLDIDNLMKSRR